MSAFSCFEEYDADAFVGTLKKCFIFHGSSLKIMSLLQE